MDNSIKYISFCQFYLHIFLYSLTNKFIHEISSTHAEYMKLGQSTEESVYTLKQIECYDFN